MNAVHCASPWTARAFTPRTSEASDAKDLLARHCGGFDTRGSRHLGSDAFDHAAARTGDEFHEPARHDEGRERPAGPQHHRRILIHAVLVRGRYIVS